MHGAIARLSVPFLVCLTSLAALTPKGCGDPKEWDEGPRGGVYALRHSLNNAPDLTWQKPDFWWVIDKKYEFFDPTGDGPQPPSYIFVQKHGGDLGAPAGEGFSWYEAAGEHNQDYPVRWDSPPGAVFHLTHYPNLADQGNFSVTGSSHFWPCSSYLGRMEYTNTNLTTLKETLGAEGYAPWCGGDLGGSANQGFCWYEAMNNSSWNYDIVLPPGMVFDLRHTANNAPGKKWQKPDWEWRGVGYRSTDLTQKPPVGFIRWCGGDRDGSSGEGFCWFETLPGGGGSVERD